jgi:hypothetical protein
MSILARPQTTTGAWTTADVLRVIADRVGGDQPPTHVQVTIQHREGDVAAVELTAKQVAMPLPTTRHVGGVSWHHTSKLDRDGMTVIAFCAVQEPAAAKRDRLTRELAELDAQIGADRG